jgi:hypothetical protein
LIAISATLSRLDDVPGIGQICDDGVGVSLGDTEIGRNVAQAYLLIAGDADQDPPMVGEKAPIGHPDFTSKLFRETLC